MGDDVLIPDEMPAAEPEALAPAAEPVEPVAPAPEQLDDADDVCDPVFDAEPATEECRGRDVPADPDHPLVVEPVPVMQSYHVLARHTRAMVKGAVIEAASDDEAGRSFCEKYKVDSGAAVTVRPLTAGEHLETKRVKGGR